MVKDDAKGQKSKLELHEKDGAQLRKKRGEILRAPEAPAAASSSSSGSDQPPLQPSPEAPTEPAILPINNPAQREPPKAISGPEAQPAGPATIPNVLAPPEPEPPNVAPGVAVAMVEEAEEPKREANARE